MTSCVYNLCIFFWGLFIVQTERHLLWRERERERERDNLWMDLLCLFASGIWFVCLFGFDENTHCDFMYFFDKKKEKEREIRKWMLHKSTHA